MKYDLAVGFTPVGVNLHGEVLLSGTIDSVNGAGNEFTDAAANFTSLLSTVNLAANTYLFEVTSGTQNGAVAVITDATSTTVTVEGTGLAAGTASYTIRKAKTLNEFFGTGDNAQLSGSFNSNSSDVVWLPDGSGDYDTYYYNSNFNEFRSTKNQFSSPSKPISFFYPDGAFVEVKSTPKTVTVFGEVKTTATIIAAPSGFSVFSVPSPLGQTLDELGIKDDLTKSFNSVGADVVWVGDGAGGYDTFFVHNLNVWRSTESQFSGDEGAKIVTGAVAIQRKGSATSMRAELPTFFNTL
jgi:hypothetical protein